MPEVSLQFSKDENLWSSLAILKIYGKDGREVISLRVPWKIHIISVKGDITVHVSGILVWGVRWTSSYFPFIGTSNLPSREKKGIALFALNQSLTFPNFPLFSFSHLSGQDCEDVPKHFLWSALEGTSRHFQLCELGQLTSLLSALVSILSSKNKGDT